MRDQVSIIVTSYFRKDFTAECLSRLNVYTDNYHLILVDNNSDQETRDMLWDFQENGLIHDLVLLNENRGLEPAKNIGLSLVKSDIFCDMDNDIYVQEGWLEDLLRLKEKYPEYAAIAAHPQDFIGDDINLLLNDENEIREYSKCGASARIMETALVRQVGGWRTEGDLKTLTRGEEFYISGKMHELGKKVGYARDVEVYHAFSNNENWGYDKDVEHYHNPIWPMPKDSDYETVKGRKDYE